MQSTEQPPSLLAGPGDGASGGQFIRQDGERSQFLAKLTHDLRTPLSSIIGFSDLLTAGIDGRLNKRQLELVQAIARNGHHLLGMINDLLDLSTMEAGQITLRREDVALQTLLDDVRAATQPLLDNAQVQMTWPMVADGDVGWFDRRRIAQVLINLIENARKHSPPGGKVAVAMAIQGGVVHIEVADNGPGIPEDEHTRVFRPFYRRGVPSGGADHGVGLGLAIVKGIIDQHGGTVNLTSGIGRGCRVAIALPARHGGMS
jgi:signal transduction histidine kinase